MVRSRAIAGKPEFSLENQAASRLDPGLTESQETQAKHRKWCERG
jgi:hypothetical protein